MSFAQVLAEATIEDAGVMAWRQVPASFFEVPAGAVEDARTADGSRVTVWPAAGAWVAACARPGAADVTVVALPARPTVTDAAALAMLVGAATARAAIRPSG
ncbi:MAG: hypothetical protein WCK58_03470 [Chloroflexota bacterium]